MDAAGRLWVRRQGPANTPRLYDVFGTTGAHVATITFPTGRVLLGFGAAGLYAAEVDEDGRELRGSRPWIGWEEFIDGVSCQGCGLAYFDRAMQRGTGATHGETPADGRGLERLTDSHVPTHVTHMPRLMTMARPTVSEFRT